MQKKSTSIKRVMINGQCWIKVSEDAMLQSFTNEINEIRPCKMLQGGAANYSDLI